MVKSRVWLCPRPKFIDPARTCLQVPHTAPFPHRTLPTPPCSTAPAAASARHPACRSPPRVLASHTVWPSPDDDLKNVLFDRRWTLTCGYKPSSALARSNTNMAALCAAHNVMAVCAQPVRTEGDTAGTGQQVITVGRGTEIDNTRVGQQSHPCTHAYTAIDETVTLLTPPFHPC